MIVQVMPENVEVPPTTQPVSSWHEDGCIEGSSEGLVETEGLVVLETFLFLNLMEGRTEGGVVVVLDFTEGTADGIKLGSSEGSKVGRLEGSIEGMTLGCTEEGPWDGSLEGNFEGFSDGCWLDGLSDGTSVGLIDGSTDGSTDDGITLGSPDGTFDGREDGLFDGMILGCTEGETEGCWDGWLDGVVVFVDLLDLGLLVVGAFDEGNSEGFPKNSLMRNEWYMMPMTMG